MPGGFFASDGFNFEQRWGTEKNNYWEPTIAADPSSDWVYQLTTDLPSQKILFRAIDGDTASTWSTPIQVCRYKGVGWQYDPQIKVANNGDIYVACLNKYDKPGVLFTKSVDHGQAWTTPIAVDGQLLYSDKPQLLISHSVQDVYIAFNNKLGLYVATSHDFGLSFSEPVLATTEKLWYYPYGGAIAASTKKEPNGVVYFAVVGEYGSSKNVNDQTGHSEIEMVASRDRGETWHTIHFDTGQAGALCEGPHCYPDFFAPQDAIAIDSAGNMVFAYTRNDVAFGPSSLYLSLSNGGGRWTPPIRLNAQGNNTSPAIETGPMPGDFRIVWQDNRPGSDGTSAWNTWYARSINRGQTWSEATRLSNLGTGADYKTADGYEFPYGDYLGFSVDAAGINHVIWGEGTSVYTGGGSWYTRD